MTDAITMSGSSDSADPTSPIRKLHTSILQNPLGVAAPGEDSAGAPAAAMARQVMAGVPASIAP